MTGREEDYSVRRALNCIPHESVSLLESSLTTVNVSRYPVSLMEQTEITLYSICFFSQISTNVLKLNFIYLFSISESFDCTIPLTGPLKSIHFPAVLSHFFTLSHTMVCFLCDRADIQEELQRSIAQVGEYRRIINHALLHPFHTFPQSMNTASMWKKVRWSDDMKPDLSLYYPEHTFPTMKREV